MGWQPRTDALPGETPLEGRRVRLVPLAWPEPGRSLAGLMVSEPDDLWRYMMIGPFRRPEEFEAAIRAREDNETARQMAILDPHGAPLGTASFLRIRAEHGSAELGSIAFSSKMQRSPAGTEAMYLMMRHLFDELGWRRCEWQCNDRNERSLAAARRLGFTYEGTFRNDRWTKGESRDTAWFSIVPEEWPSRKAALEAWLEDGNFDEAGRQIRPLAEFRT